MFGSMLDQDGKAGKVSTESWPITSLKSSAAMFAVPDTLGRCSIGSNSCHTRNRDGSLSPKGSRVVRPMHRPGSVGALRKRPTYPFVCRDWLPGSGLPTQSGAGRDAQADFGQAFGGEPLKDWSNIVDQCTVDARKTVRFELPIDEVMGKYCVTSVKRVLDAPTGVRSDLPIDDLLNRSCVTSLKRSQSLPALPKQGNKNGKQRTPMPIAHLVFDQNENGKEFMDGRKIRRRSFGAAGRAIQAAVRMRRNSIG